MRDVKRPMELPGLAVALNVATAALAVLLALWGACHAAEAVTGDVATGASAGVETFFQTELGQVVLASIGAVASAAFAQFMRSQWLLTRTNVFGRKLIMWGGSAVAAVYTSKVRKWKANQPSGLSPQQKIEAENDAMALVRHAAAAEGYANHPMIKDDMLLRGAVVQAVAVAKRAGATRPTTKGGV